MILDGDTGPLAFNHRQIQIVSNPNNSGQPFTTTLQNDNTSANIWVINTDLLNALSSATGARTLGLAGSNAGDNEFKGAISNGTGDGVLGVTKSGAGKWILSGANSYSGTTTVSAGRLVLNNDDSLPASGILDITSTSARVEIIGRARIAELHFGGSANKQASGIWGSSSADPGKVDYADSRFEGTGLLYVGDPYPPSGTLMILK